jgi:hypothetical protein
MFSCSHRSLAEYTAHVIYPEFDEQEEDEDDQENHRALQNCFEVENHKVKEEAESEGDYPKFSQIFVHDKENGVKSESKDDL